MIYKEQQLIKPTREQVEECYAKHNFKWNIEDVITYWEKRNWDVVSLDSALQRFSNKIYAYIKRYNTMAKRSKLHKINKSHESLDNISKMLANAPVGENTLKLPKSKKKSCSKNKSKKIQSWTPYDEQLVDER